MKWLVYLFALYVLILGGIPCDADDECCSNTEQTDPHKPVSPCSPFFACGAIHAIVVPDTYIVKLVCILPDATLHSDYVTPQLQDRAPAIWQPPRQV